MINISSRKHLVAKIKRCPSAVNPSYHFRCNYIYSMKIPFQRIITYWRNTLDCLHCNFLLYNSKKIFYRLFVCFFLFLFFFLFNSIKLTNSVAFRIMKKRIHHIRISLHAIKTNQSSSTRLISIKIQFLWCNVKLIKLTISIINVPMQTQMYDTSINIYIYIYKYW